MYKKGIFLVMFSIILLSSLVHGIALGQEQEDVKISQKERAAILHRIKNISLSVEIDSLLKVELEGPYASLQTISSKDVPEKRQKIEKWLLQILKIAFERAGYKVVGEKQNADARLLAQYDETHVMTLGGEKMQHMFIFDLKLVLTHPQYGELFSTKLSTRAINTEVSDAIIAGKDIVIVGIAPSEEIKNATLKDLQNKLPFQGGYWKPAKEGSKYSATFKDSVGNEILGEFGSEVRWEWKEDGTIVITKWDAEATFKFCGDHGQWYYLKNEYIKTHIISLSPGFTGTISGNIKKYEIEMVLSLKDVNWTESVGASGTLPIYSNITGMAGVGATEDEAKANLSPIQMRKDLSGRNIIYIEQKRPFRGLKVFYFKIKSGSIYLDEETFKKLEGPPLNKERSKILILIDGKKEKSVEAVQYHGLVKESVKLPAGIVETEAQLREGLSKSGYKIPNVDFRSNLVLFVLSSEPQCIQIDVDAVSFENGQLTNIIKTERMRGGAEKDGKNAFTLIVIPKSAIE